MVNRKEIYNKFGIEYKNEKILSPLGWICPLLKEGNAKTGEKVYTYSQLPGTGYYTARINGFEFTEKGTCACDCTECYAKTGRYACPSVIRSMLINTWLVNHDIDFVKRAISAQIEILGRIEIRIHAAGDFNTQNSDEYVAMWKELIAKYQIKLHDIWTYTKIRKYENAFDEYKNANIVKSVIPGFGFNYGHCEYIINTYKALKAAGKKVYICMCGIDKNQHCENCSVCALYEYVLFIEHSTDYKAENDPLYPVLCELARNQ